ncbi:MAG: nuclear transport factor 2 family protein [Candidatus Binataceae bacterium]|nr:nuclear transport factor 2 family protein [Candidatus Binataceae bacterium]
MKKAIWVLAAFGAVALAGAPAFPASRASSAKAEITALEHKCIAAQNADEAVQCFDPNDIALYDFTPPLEYSGMKAVREHMEGVFANFKDPKASFLELEVVTDGKLGIANSIQHFTWTGKDGTPMEGNFRVSDSLHKVGGKWKIFHSHVSVPVDPATGKAVMNAKL